MDPSGVARCGKRTRFLHTLCCFGLMHLFKSIPLVGARRATKSSLRIRHAPGRGICRLVVRSLGSTSAVLPIRCRRSSSVNHTAGNTSLKLLTGICLALGECSSAVRTVRRLGTLGICSLGEECS